MNLAGAGRWIERVRARLRARPVFSKIFVNVAWLSVDRVLRLAIGLLVGVWLARYLGPETFGQYSFAVALVALFGVFSKLGLDGILVREIVRFPDARQQLLASSLALRVAGGTVGAVAAVICVTLIRPNDVLVHALVALISAGLIFQAADVFELWFQSQSRGRYIVATKSSIFLLMAAVRVALILGGATVIAFATTAVVETILGGIALIAAYRVSGQTFERWRAALRVMKGLLRPALPLIFAGFAVSLYMKIDQVMIAHFLGDHAVGLYSAATRLTEATYFLPGILVASALPAIVALRTSSERLFRDRMQRLFDVMVASAVALALPLSLLSAFIVGLLYGLPYADSAGVLAIHAWASVFVYLGMASSSYLLAEDLTIVSLYRTVLGAAVNIALNLVLIPRYGIQGAAWATLISASVATYAVLLDRRTRFAGMMMLRALNPVRAFAVR